jgi:dATP pyrophosphohydrolase
MKEIKFSTIQVHPFIKINNDFKYLILKRNSNSKIYGDMWQVITGKIEIGETAYNAAKRELLEETGHDCINLYHIPFVGSFYDWRNDNIETIPCFAAEINSNEIQLSAEHSEYKFINHLEIKKYIELPSHLIASDHLLQHIINNPNKKNFLINI